MSENEPEIKPLNAGGPPRAKPAVRETGGRPADDRSTLEPAGHLELIAGLFTALLIVSNVASCRLATVGPLEFDAGTLMFPLTYVFGDLLAEVYGYARSRRVIWTGFAALFLAALCFQLASLFPAPPGWEEAALAWDQALSPTPRLALGSLTAYLAGEFANSMTLIKMKRKNPDGATAWRFLASTLVGQAFDTLIFASVAFLGLLDARLWLTLVVSNYVYKVGLEAALLPVTVWLARRLKRAEGLEAQNPSDAQVSLNPFRWRLDRPRRAEPGQAD
ncbi:MAG: queuosine precursor transporter [Deltaproteobacteria bacterium]|jgi:uncharacterized integral membrane protein (TIGR00697 family)|nr:queuosine precursor transporter [Deltaproteobacteria bacterium]